MLKPKWMASKEANMVLSTEAQPLIPQAQGMAPGCFFPRKLRPKGKGIPMKKAKGAIRAKEIKIRMVSGSTRPH